MLIDAKLGILLVIGSGKVQIVLATANVYFINFFLPQIVPIHQSLVNTASVEKR